MKKLLAIVLCMIFMLSVFPTVGVSAAETSGVCGENVTWEFDEATGTLTISGEGRIDDSYNVPLPWEEFKMSIKEVVIGEGVTEIGEDAFHECGALEKATLPEGLLKIGGGAFSGCAELTSLSIPESVKVIRSGAFSSCRKLQFRIEDNAYYLGNEKNPYHALIYVLPKDISSCRINPDVKIISDEAFAGCTELTSAVIPEGVVKIEGNTFYGCTSLKTVTIPRSVREIGMRAFAGCFSLKDVYYGGAEEDWEGIAIDKGNEPALSAERHFRSAAPEEAAHDGGPEPDDNNENENGIPFYIWIVAVAAALLFVAVVVKVISNVPKKDRKRAREADVEGEEK